MRKASVFVALLGFYVYRSRYTLKNTFLSKHPFPEGYYHNGDFNPSCVPLKDPKFSHNTNVEAFQSCEDMTHWELLTHSGQLLDRVVISSCDAGRKEWNTVMGPLSNPEPRGSLWTFSSHWGLKELSLRDSGYPDGHDFHPLGIAVSPSRSGAASNLFVINHARRQTTIEQFTLTPETGDHSTTLGSKTALKWIRTITSPWFIAPNSLALTSDSSFYVTNDHFFTRRLPILGRLMPMLETMFALPLPWAAHVDVNTDLTLTGSAAIKSHSIVAPFIPFANGIAVSPQGDEVAIASTSMTGVYLYSRDPKTNKLTAKDFIQVPFAIDNIHYHDDGSIITAGHPHALEMLNPKTRYTAPSWVILITPTAKKSTIFGNVSNSSEDIAPVSSTPIVQLGKCP